MEKLKTVYFGTPSFSADFLEKLLTDKELPLEIISVVTQPDKKVGRKQILTPTPVKLMAEKYNVTTLTNSKVESLKSKIKNIDLAIVFAYGEILPKEILQIPRLGFWNIHPSLLPLYRGASPIAYPLINGDTKTGVTLMKMDEQMDHGPIIDQVEYEIQPSERRPNLEKKLTNMGFDLLKDVISTRQLAGRNPHEISHFASPAGRQVRDDRPREQDHTKATYTKLLKKEDGFIPLRLLKKALNDEPFESDELPQLMKDYVSKNKLTMKQFNNETNETIFNLYRGLHPWPGIWTLLRLKASEGQAQEKRLKITDMTYEDGKLIITKVQLEGKNEVDYKTFKQAYGDLTTM